MIAMRAFAIAAASLAALTVSASAQTRIDAINTNFRWLGPDDKIVVERYDDPRVANVSCYMSRAQTGGIKGGLASPRTRAGSPLRAGRSARSTCRRDCRKPK
jgi:CreA protein